MGLPKSPKSKFDVPRVGGHGVLPGHITELAVLERKRGADLVKQS